MAKRTKDLSGGDALSVAPYAVAMDWVDAYARATEGWFDWQRAMWQPLADAQAEYLRQWSELSGWPMPQAVPVRGGEQLA